MFNIFKRLNGKEWLMIVASTILVCLAVWMDLKTPEYMSDITRMLQTKGTKLKALWDPGLKMLAFSFGSFLVAVMVGFLGARTAASFTSRLRSDIFNHVMDYSDAEIKRFSIPSLLTRTTNDLTQLQILIVMGMQVVTRGPIMAIWALTKIWGKSDQWTGTVRSNMVFGESGREELSDEQIWQALELAQAKEFIEAKEKGLDTEVAQGGSNFSGGQKQRLAIARALARHPEILIFDDSLHFNYHGC